MTGGPNTSLAERWDLARWGGSLACILALHGAVVVGVALRGHAAIEPSEALPAVLIDLSPPPAAPALAETPPAPSEPIPGTARAEPVVEQPPDIPEPDLPLPTPIMTAEAPPPPDPVEVPPLPPLPTPPVPVAEPAVVLPPPPPKAFAPPKPAQPVERKREPPRPKPAPVRQAERSEPRPRPPASAANTQTTASIPSTTSGSATAARSSWQGAIVSALNRAKRPQSETGLASVRFSIDRSGRVLSAGLAGSAGSSALDGEAVALVRRASIPAAPAEVTGGPFTFTVPIRFTSR